MSKSNPQDAMVGDLIMWTSNYGGFSFGKIISFNRDGVPMVRPISQPYFKEYDWVEDLEDFKPVPWGAKTKDGVKGYYRLKQVKVDEHIPLRYSGGHQAGYNWMIIAYGPNNPKARTVTEEHPIAKAKRQFAELESETSSPF